MTDTNPESPRLKASGNTVIARTVLRTFLATPPLLAQDVENQVRADEFKTYFGTLAATPRQPDWLPLNSALRGHSRIVPLPDLESLLGIHYPAAERGRHAVAKMLEDALGIHPAYFNAGFLARTVPGWLPFLSSREQTGHLIIIENSAYRNMARTVCKQLADPKQGAQLLGFQRVEDYRDALKKPYPADALEHRSLAQRIIHREQEEFSAGKKSIIKRMRSEEQIPGIMGKADEWSEARDIVKNMLRESQYGSDGLEPLKAAAAKHDFWEFVQIVDDYQKQTLAERRTAAPPAGGQGR